MSQGEIESLITTENETDLVLNFKKKECQVFIENHNRIGECVACGKRKTEGFHLPSYLLKSFEQTWTSEKCTRSDNTDAYGKIRFPISKAKTANFIRVADDTSTKTMLHYLYSKQGLNLPRPNLILSIAGSAKDAQIPFRIRKAFNTGLVKVAASANTWIITNGTNGGVASIVGEAVSRQQSLTPGLVLLGITTWGTVALRDKLRVPGNNLSEFTHDQYIDDPMVNTLYNSLLHSLIVEENKNMLLNNKNRPTIQYKRDYLSGVKPYSGVLLEQNHNNFILVDDGTEMKFGHEAAFRVLLENEITTNYGEQLPMVLVLLNGDLDALSHVRQSLETNVPVVVLAESGGCANLICSLLEEPRHKRYSKIKELLIGSKLFYKMTRTKETEATENLYSIFKPGNEHLLSIFSLENVDGQVDIERAIFEAIFKKNESLLDKGFKNMLHVLAWNRVDIARELLVNGGEALADYQMRGVLKKALEENKWDFVDLFLGSGVNLQASEMLYDLYNCSKAVDLASDLQFYELFERVCSKNKDAEVEFRDIQAVLDSLQLPYGFNSIFLPEDESDSQANTKFLEINLLVWAIFFNRYELAKIFYRNNQQRAHTALYSSILLKRIAIKTKSVGRDSSEIIKFFEDEACEAIRNLEPSLQREILSQQVAYCQDFNCIQVALKGKLLKFLALPCVQKHASDVWNGDFNHFSCLSSILKLVLSVVSFGLLAPFLYSGCNKKSRSVEKVDKEIGYSKRLVKFLETPVIKFVYDVLFYHLFLLLFSYVLLVNNTYSKSPTTDTSNLSGLNDSNASLIDSVGIDDQATLGSALILELLLALWILQMVINDIREVEIFVLGSRGLFDRMSTYLSNYWNRLKAIGYIVYVIGTTLKLIAFFTTESVFFYSKVVLALDLAIWYILLLRCGLVFEPFGRKLLMVVNMLKNLPFFVIVSLLFLSFNSTIQVIFNNAIPPSAILWSNTGQTKFVDLSDSYQMIFKVFLLIVFFTTALSLMYQKSYVENEIFWRYQRIKFMGEYFNNSIFPAPICFFGYLLDDDRNINRNIEFKNKESFEMNHNSFGIKQQESENWQFEFNILDKKLKKIETKLNETVDMNVQISREFQDLKNTLNQQNKTMNWMIECMTRIPKMERKDELEYCPPHLEDN